MNQFEKNIAVDVSRGVESKGGLSYLSWGVAWHELMKVDPEATFNFYPWETLPDQTVMVKVGVTAFGREHTIQLPVMNHRNQAIVQPDSRAVSDAQMRCLVKAIGFHGIGLTLYMGAISDAVTNPLYSRCQEAMADGAMVFHEWVKNLDEESQKEAFNSAPAGEKTAMKSHWRALLKEAEDALSASMDAIVAGCIADDPSAVLEAVEELTEYEKGIIWLRLDDKQRADVREAMNTSKEAA